MGNYKLPIITGRYNQTDREERYCNECNDGLIGDEYRFVTTSEPGYCSAKRQLYT